jgi:ABC-type polysaccharide/polyol phosphate transport system ATPase subunit
MEALRQALSREVQRRCALQEALALAEAERNLLRAEERKLRREYRRTHAELSSLTARAAAPPRPQPPAVPAATGAKLRSLPGPAVIEARGLHKTYSVPSRPVETLKERVLHPWRSSRSTTLEALRDVSFDVRRGEFLGIAGANGSGKSTLLKLLANVYAPDSGTIRTAGRIAPFIELGVGLNPEFAAYDNVVISGVTMGLEPEEARARYPEIVEFAGLEEFTELKLKNYSSGMRVRLAFAVMAQVDADILLIDEVLAVGDAEFREKCLARTERLRGEGKTIVLVTHSMETLAKECDRAILLSDGEIRIDGDPAEVARRYRSELETAGAAAAQAGEGGAAMRLVKG